MNAEILPNGDLLLTVGADEREDIGAMLADKRDWWSLLSDLFEPYFTNGSYQPFDAGDANPFVGLTSAPCIAESMTTEDNGDNVIDGRLWWYPDYMICDPLENLARSGQSIWKLAA